MPGRHYSAGYRRGYTLPKKRKYTRSTRSYTPRRNYTGYRRTGLTGIGRGGNKKFVDLQDTLTTTGTGTTGADNASNLTIVAVASGPKNRNNMAIAVHSLYIRGDVELTGIADGDASVTDASETMIRGYVRIAVVLDKQPNKSAITAAQIWDFNDVNSPLNLDQRKRVKILLDKTCPISRSQVSYTSNDEATLMLLAGGNVRLLKKWYLKFKKPIRVEFDPDVPDGAITDITENAISIWIMTGTFATTNYVPKFNFISRVRFTDVI